MDLLQVQSRLSVRDLGRLSYVILSDCRSLAARVICCGTAFDPSASIELTCILRTSSRDKSASPGKETSDILFTETNWINGLVCSDGSLDSSQIAASSLLWEITLLRLFSVVPESQIGGVLSLVLTYQMVERVRSYVPLIPRTHSVSLSLSRSFGWTARSSTSFIAMFSESTESTPS